MTVNSSQELLDATALAETANVAEAPVNLEADLSGTADNVELGGELNLGAEMDLAQSSDTAETEEWDPNAAIASAELSDAQTDNLSASVNTEASDQVKEALERAGSFGTLDVSDFSDFKVADYVPQDGEYPFTVEQKYLREAMSMIKQVGSVSKSSLSAMKVTLFKDKIKLSCFNQSALCETSIPTFQPIEKHAHEGKEISFIFDQNLMGNIADSFVDAVVEFSFVAKTNLLVIRSGNTTLKLSTGQASDFVEYHNKIDDLKLLGKVNPAAIQDALKYSMLFAKKDNIQLNLSLVHLKGKKAISGNIASIGVAEYSNFSQDPNLELDLPIKYELVKVVQNVLKRMDPESTYLYDAGNFMIFRDSSTYAGIEKINFAFPPTEAFFKLEKSDNILIPRASLINSLLKLSVVATDNKLLLNCHLTGEGAESTLELTTLDAAGKESRDSITVHRTIKNGDKEDRRFGVSIHYLARVVNYFSSTNVSMSLMPKGMILEDADAEIGYQCSSILPSMSQEALSRTDEAADE